MTKFERTEIGNLQTGNTFYFLTDRLKKPFEFICLDTKNQIAKCIVKQVGSALKKTVAVDTIVVFLR